MDKVRIDKWLWAARFYKTRSIAKQAIEGGKVHIDGQRVKASKEIETGTLIRLRQGWEMKEVEVLALSDQRKSASLAQQLYRETESSLERRQSEAEQRKTAQGLIPGARGKPTTRQRRQIHRFKRDFLDE